MSRPARPTPSRDDPGELPPGVVRIADPLERAMDRIVARSEPAPAPPFEPLLWTFDSVAKALGISRRTLERERSAGRFPRPDVHIGKRPMWKPETIRRWIDAQGVAR